VTTIVDWLARLITFLNANGSAIAALATLFIALFTWRLWVSTEKLWKESKSAAASAKQSADAAVKTAMPVLYPWVLDMHALHPLHPILEISVTHTARMLVGFDNFGNSPGTIREVRADLFLTEGDKLPDVDVGTLTLRDYQVMVPGDCKAIDAQFGALDLQQEFTFTPTEMVELRSEATGSFRRFALVGRVVYDDFFGLRHSSHFCVKLRLWRVGAEVVGPKKVMTFQVAVGGSKYNGVATGPIPSPDPLSQ
jgi:hypothetical protein